MLITYLNGHSCTACSVDRALGHYEYVYGDENIWSMEIEAATD